jgi:hypothetical protein
MAAIAAVVIVAAPSLDAYLKLGTFVGTDVVSLRWTTMPIRYFVTNRDVPGVSAQQLQQAVTRAFASWDAVPDVQLSSSFAGFTQAPPLDEDGMTVVGFANRPDLDRVLGSTSFTVDTESGEIVEADVFLNSAFAWSVAASGETDRYDVESIALHEIGHLHGLGHSALGETELRAGGRRVLGSGAVMFPIAFSAGSIDERRLQPDDIAGISDLYGTSAFHARTGSISGRVTKNGAGVLGAHVVAFDPASGALVGGFTLDQDGSFVIGGLDPGVHVLRVEPLDDAEIDSFFDASTNVDVDFVPTFCSGLVVVPRGGTASGVEVTVMAK